MPPSRRAQIAQRRLCRAPGRSCMQPDAAGLAAQPSTNLGRVEPTAAAHARAASIVPEPQHGS